MKRFNGVYVALTLFGIINFLDALEYFGGDAVDLPPIQFLLYSSWILVRNTVCYTLIMVVPTLIFGRHSRFLLIVLFCYVLGIEVATMYSEKVFYADLSSVWLSLLENTSFQEIGAFLRMSASGAAVLGVILLMLIMAIGSVLIWRAHYPKVSKRSCMIGVAVCVPFLLANCLLISFQNGNWKFGINQMRYTKFVFGTIKAITEMSGINQACKNIGLPEKLSTGVIPEDMPDAVFVLGESSTRNNWHLYGYPRQTTPRMDALYEHGEVFKLDDVVGTQPATVEALAFLLTDVSFDNKIRGTWTLAEVYRRAGYRCVLISNQYTWGDTTSTLYKIFNGCEKRLSPRIEFGKKGYDEKLVEILQNEFQNGDGRPTVAFLHLAGIHYPVRPDDVHPPEDAHFTDRVDEDFMEQFKPRIRDRLNRYDDGILYEDKVLGMIVDVLRQRARPSFMFFISDHGESPRSETWRSYIDEDTYELPALLWASESYRLKFPKTVRQFAKACSKKMQSDEMTHGLLELGFIQIGAAYSQGMSFMSDEFRGRNPRFINKGRTIYSKDDISQTAERPNSSKTSNPLLNPGE